MDIQDLRIVLAVAKAGSYNQAAEALGVSHQAVSKAMKRIGRETVEPLFSRSAGKVDPTEFGMSFMADAANLTRQFAEFEMRYVVSPSLPASKQVHDVLNIALVMGGTLGLPEGFFEQFTLKNPTVSLSVEEMSSEAVLRSVADDEYEIGILGTHPNLVKGFEARGVMRMGIWILVPEGHPWDSLESVPLSALDRQPFVTAGRRNHLPRYVMDRCAEEGVQMNVVATASSGDMMINLAMERNALCFGFDPKLTEPPAGTHAVRLDFYGADEFGTYAIRKPDGHHSPIGERFWNNELMVIG